MVGNSQPVTSNQAGIHPELVKTVERHLRTTFRKPLSRHTGDAYDSMQQSWQRAGCPPLILDAGCGVGRSTLTLALRNPDHFVVGVDQSADRLRRGLARQPGLPSNLLLLRADLVDFWSLLAADRVTLARHYLLYPNPWPRKQHLMRRWHGHPVFPLLLNLGGEIECRSNWLIYVQEFATVLTHLLGTAIDVERWQPADDAVLTPFEAKYCASGHELWRCRTRLAARHAFSGNTGATVVLP